MRELRKAIALRKSALRYFSLASTRVVRRSIGSGKLRISKSAKPSICMASSTKDIPILSGFSCPKTGSAIRCVRITSLQTFTSYKTHINKEKHPSGASFFLNGYNRTTLARTHFRNSLKVALSPKTKRFCTYSTIIAAGK